jgi:Mn2+/Fe2+ NRAMP family transporter
MAATAIGASHLVLSVQAGAIYGYDLLWVVVAANLLKYPAFEYGPRFALATGRSLLDGYAHVPGPRGWALWLFLFGTVVQGISVVGGVLGLTASILYAVIPAPGITGWSSILATAVVVLLIFGRYQGLELAIKVMMGVLLLATLVAFFATPMPISAVRHLMIPVFPAGAIALIVALAGWMPSGIDVSIWHSLWALEKRKRWVADEIEGDDLLAAAVQQPQELRAGGAAAAEPDDAATSQDNAMAATVRFDLLRRSLLDMRASYLFTTMLALLFLGLGAALLHPRGLVLQSAEVAPTIARIYTESLGAWMYPVFLVAAFCAMFSTAFACMDGFPRAFANTLRVLGYADRGRFSYWSFMMVIYAGSLALLVWWPDPVPLVTAAAIISFLFSPVYAALNTYCTTRLIAAAECRPGRGSTLLAVIGATAMAITAVVYLADFLL